MTDDLEARFRELEREVGANPPPTRPMPQPEAASVTGAIAQGWQGLTGWIHGLTGPAKIVAIVVVGLLAFKLLSFFLNLLSTLISLGLLAGVAYVLYKVFGPKQP
ncbi:MAG: hypothetical protein HC918_04355 [Oscillatoriales cyanobacterium SM2_1_8]|nr:hypothetical protein [Oscillatoriales cyanobacterium SM2_1_8]